MSSVSRTSIRFAGSAEIIAFPGGTRRSTLRLACSNEDAPMRVCGYCGGWMAADENDEDCSSRLRFSKA